MARRTAHSIVEVKIVEGPVGSALPVLILENGEISLLGLAWAREMMIRDARSPQSLSKAIEALGLFYDYYKLVEHGRTLSVKELQWMMLKFSEARQFGNSILGWRATSRQSAAAEFGRINKFSDFCAENLGHIPINKIEKSLIANLSFQERATLYYKMESKKSWDKLAHLTPSTDQGQGIIQRRSIRIPVRRQKQSFASKHFPPDKVLPLLNATKSVRDKMFLLLIFFGGLRESEPLHLFVTDIHLMKNGDSKVILGDPELDSYEWVDTFRGQQHGSRSEFLQKRYGLGPRSKLGIKNPLFSGWKSMAYTDDRMAAEVYWLVPEMGKYFALLHSVYMRSIRNHVPDSHPYYFVNEIDGDFFGSPLKISNVTKMFYRAVERIGLTPSDPGVSPHGARHFYGYFCASHLKMPIERTQMMMHHCNLTSTQCYYKLDQATLRAEIEEGYARIASSIPRFCDEAARILGEA